MSHCVDQQTEHNITDILARLTDSFNTRLADIEVNCRHQTKLINTTVNETLQHAELAVEETTALKTTLARLTDEFKSQLEDRDEKLQKHEKVNLQINICSSVL